MLQHTDACGYAETSADTEFYFQWHVTERCNRRCRHCYHASYDSAGELSDDQLSAIADRMESALKAWERRGAISITGGEPWLRKDAVLALVDRFARGGVVDRIDLLTNGLLLSDEDCALLAARPLIRRVQVSMEGGSAAVHDSIRGKGNFDDTADVIQRLKRHSLEVAVMMTLSHQNVGDVVSLLDFLQQLDADVAVFDRFIPEGQSADCQNWLLSPLEVKGAYETIYEWAMEHRRPRVLMYRPLFCLIAPEDPHVGAMCSVGMNALTVLHDGTIYPCRRLPIPLGNVLTDSLHDIWYSSPILWKARVPSNIKGRCGTCDFVPVCRGCRAMALATSGDWLEEDPQCWLMQ